MHCGPAFGALELIGALHFLWGPQSLERGFSKAGLLLTIVGVGPVSIGGEEEWRVWAGKLETSLLDPGV